MTNCANCGHELGVGRYCTNCGHPVDGPTDKPVADPVADWRTDTAERPRVPPPPAPPPPPASPPPAARFPLFADEVDQVGPLEDHPVEPVPTPLPAQTQHRRSRRWSAWVALAVVLVLVLLLGVWLVLRGDDDPVAKEPSTSPSGSAPGTGKDPSPQDSASPDAPVGLTAQSKVTVPETAGPGQDTEGNPVDYDASNMLDGVPETCWRMPGDGTGEEIVITLPGKTRLRSVGLINGYAKKGGDVDWYHGNRRIDRVEWVFDDGTTLDQTLGDTESVQSQDVDVTTTTITLRLVKVSAPGKGSSRRDFTAISDLLFVAR